MATYTTEERLALLLSVLGKDASKAAFKSMHPTRAKYVEQLLAEYQVEPPSSDEIDYVVNDFNKYFAFAMETMGAQLGKTAQAAAAEADKKAAGKSKVGYFEVIQPSGDVIHDLNRLHAFQIASAVANDHPKTIALVLRNLDSRLAAAVLEQMPEDARLEAAVFLTQESTVPDRIVNQVLQSTFEKGNSVRSRKEDVDKAQVMAELLRSLPKDIRKQLLDRLASENPDLVSSVRAKLYVFEDVLRLGDRDVQKVLGEIETDILIVGLQQADEKLVDRLLSNLSKRARQTIQEEMEYKSGVAQEEIDEARQQLVAALGALDESGDITLH
jgi:flagellar motor switch protein FliG